jgi:hypothetical protein
MARVEEGYQQIQEQDQEVRVRVGTNGRSLKVGIAVAFCFGALLSFTVVTALARGPGAAPSSFEPVALDSICGGIAQEDCAKKLTVKYLDLRFNNDVKGLEGLLAKDSKLTIDSSDAGWVVPMKLNYAMGFSGELDGPKGVCTFFKKLPTEGGDVKPVAKDISCKGDKCTIHASVSRFGVGKITDVGTLDWDTAAEKLKSVHSKFSV